MRRRGEKAGGTEEEVKKEREGTREKEKLQEEE